MELWDQFRDFVLENYVKPARARGETSFVCAHKISCGAHYS